MRIIIICFLLWSCISVQAQQSKKDSLYLQLKKANNDTLLSDAHSSLGYYFTNKELLLDSALFHYRSALGYAQKSGKSKFLWRAFYDIASNNINHGELDSAFVYFNRTLDYTRDVPTREVESYAGLGNAYFLNGEYIKAYEFFLKQLKAAEAVGSPKTIARAHGNIGVILKEQRKYDDALPHFQKSIELNKKAGDEKGLCIAYINTGNVLYEKSKINKDSATKIEALKLYMLAKPMAKYAANSYNMRVATVLLHTNIGNIYSELKDYKRAIEENLEATKLIDTYGYLPQSALVYTNLASLYVDVHDAKNAAATLKKAKEATDHLGGIDNYEQFYLVQSRYYELTGDYKNAYLSQLKYKKYSDSLFNSDNSEKRKELELNYEFDKKEAAAKAEQEKREAIAEVEKKRQRLILYATFAGFSLMALLSFFIYRGYRNKKKANEIITLQKKEVEEAKQIIEKQKEIVEEKQKEVLDSIHYAKRIQDALFAGSSVIESNLGKDFFILFQPKDIVSGDFYWATEHGDYFFLAVCDSTGHGVPGAFMSLLNIGFMSEAINEKGILEPHEVFNYVRRRLVNSISKEGQKDGFDGILLRLDKRNSSLCYSASHNKPVLVRDGTLMELPCDKMPVGKGENDLSFTLHEIREKDAFLYLFTDGYADQFGGEKGKKLKYKSLYNALTLNAPKSAAGQKDALQNIFTEWKGRLEQVDDVLVLGLKI